MACGSCGGKKTSNMEFEVTFMDGTKQRYATLIEARIAAQQDRSTRIEGGPRAPMTRAVPKAR